MENILHLRPKYNDYRSTNTIFKEYDLWKDATENFFCQYDIFQKEVVSTEDGYRLESTQKKPMYCTRQPIERHAAEKRGLNLSLCCFVQYHLVPRPLIITLHIWLAFFACTYGTAHEHASSLI
jgi:hypothetical protein